MRPNCTATTARFHANKQEVMCFVCGRDFCLFSWLVTECLFAYVTSAIFLDCFGQSFTVFSLQTILTSLCSTAVEPTCWFASCQALREQQTPIYLHVITSHYFGQSDQVSVSGAMYSRLPFFRTQYIVRFRFVV